MVGFIWGVGVGGAASCSRPRSIDPLNTHHTIKSTNNRFFLGKNKLMQKALGTRPEDEIRDNLRHLTKVTE